MLMGRRKPLASADLVVDRQTILIGAIEDGRTVRLAQTLGGIEPQMLDRLEIGGIARLLSGLKEREFPLENRAVLIAGMPRMRRRR